MIPTTHIPRHEPTKPNPAAVLLGAAIVAAGLAVILAGWLVMGILVTVFGITVLAGSIEGGER